MSDRATHASNPHTDSVTDVISTRSGDRWTTMRRSLSASRKQMRLDAHCTDRSTQSRVWRLDPPKALAAVLSGVAASAPNTQLTPKVGSTPVASSAIAALPSPPKGRTL